MSLPYDLSPAEANQLQSLLRGAELPDLEKRPRLEPEQIEGNPNHPNLEDGDDPTPEPFLDLRSGQGAWQNHSFTLTEPQLRKVHRIIAQCVATNLEAEIGRLRASVREMQ